MKEPEDRFELLAAVAGVADLSLELEETVARLLEIIVPGFADLAALDAFPTEDGARRLGVRIAPGVERRVELERLVGERRQVPGAPYGVSSTMRTGASQLLDPLTDAQLRDMVATEADFEAIRTLGLRSALYVPLRARGQTIGAFGCSVGPSGRRYDEDDLRFAEVLAGRIALVLNAAGLFETVSDLERRLEVTLASVAEAVVVRDPAGTIVYANPSALRMLELDDDAVGRAVRGELFARYDFADEHGRELEPAELPSAQALAGVRPEPLLVRNVTRSSGRERWLVNKAAPVFDQTGTVTLVVSTIEDVTEVKRAERSQRLLAQASAALAAPMEIDHGLQHVAELSVEDVADWCVVRLLADDGRLDPVAVACGESEPEARVQSFQERSSLRLSDGSAIAEVVRTGIPRFIPEVTDPILRGAGLRRGHVALLQDLQMRSLIVVPLASGDGQTAGAISLGRAHSGRVFDLDDLALAEELGRRVAVAVAQARLYAERSSIAATLQASLLPPALPEIPGFRLASLYRAAGAHNEVGGDFYDTFAVPSGWVIAVGDVAGRGAAAAALTSLSRYTLRTAAHLLDDPIAAIGELNRALCDRHELSLVSICCAWLTEREGATEARIVLAGHPPAYHVRAGEARQVGVFAPFLGIAGVGGWEPVSVTLEPGDQLVLYTDGVIDTVGESDRFGEERLAAVLAGCTGASDAVERITAAVGGFARGPQVDDTAVLAVERVGPDAQALISSALRLSSSI